MNRIEKALHAEDWPRARALIRRALESEPDDHWLLTTLGLTYYEQRQYRRALAYSEKALAMAPRCPLVLWDRAGCMAMLGREREAIGVYKGLTRRGVRRLVRGTCSEGLVWARSLVVDCHYRLARCYQSLGQSAEARRAFRRHLALRARGYRSIYPIRLVRRRLQASA